MEFTILPVTPYQQNCSLVWDEAGRAALIDPGGEAERLLGEVAARELTLEKILLTHGHLDHVGAAVELRDALGIPIVTGNAGPPQSGDLEGEYGTPVKVGARNVDVVIARVR